MTGESESESDPTNNGTSGSEEASSTDEQEVQPETVPILDIRKLKPPPEDSADLGPAMRQVEEHPWGALAIFLLTLLSILLMVAGAIVSVLSPSRGLQDFLARTRLQPR